MPKKVKSNISFMPVVESISRKFALRRETCVEKKIGDKVVAPIKYMGSGTRTVKVAGYGAVNKNYFFMRKYQRTSPISEDEQQARINFTAVSKWVTAAMKSLQSLTQNQEKWLQASEDITKKIHGVSAAGYESMRGWMFAVAMALKTDDVPLPQDYALPNFD